MKLLILVHGLAVGGTEIMACHLARGLRRRGHSVALGCLDDVGELGERLREEGFAVECYGRRPGFDPRLGFRIAAHARRIGTELIHAHHYAPFFYAALAKPLVHARLVFTEHGRPYPDPPSWKRRAFNAVFARAADRVTAVSERVRESLRVVEGFDPARVEIVYNGIEIERWAAAPRAEARALLGVQDDERVIATVGRLDPIKNYPLLLEAFRRLRSEWPQAILLLVGDGPERPALQALAEALGIAARVRFMGRRLDAERLFPGFDVFVLSSVSEGLPMTLIEAMAARVPIVSTAVGGIPEVVCDGRDGLLVPGPPPVLIDPAELRASRYPSLLAEAVNRALAEPGLRERLAETALARARREFSLSAICDRYCGIYEAALRRPASPAGG